MMRPTQIAMVGLLTVSLAACTTGASQSPGGPSPQPSVAPSTATSPAPSHEAEILDLKVTFDGTSCTYVGPTVILDGTLTRFRYEASASAEPSVLVVIGVYPGTTWEDVEQTLPSSDTPQWATLHSFLNVEAGSSGLFTIRSDVVGQAMGGYFVGCATHAEANGGSDHMYPATLLEIAGP
jgi:hypothetical protein